MMNDSISKLHVPGIGDTEMTVTERGAGRPFLLLHGGGGPATVNPWADRFAAARPARVITPVHPGFNGTPRPEALDSPRGLAAVYAALLDELDLRDVTVIGNSIGGWITAELAVLNPGRVSRYVLVDAVGIEVPGHPVPVSMTPAELAQRAYYDPAKFGVDPAKLPPEARAAMAANQATLALYAGPAMADPTLASRLGAVAKPALVVWGEADRIGDPEFGRAFAAAIPGAGFRLLEKAGHLPQIEAPEALEDAVWTFADAQAML